MTEDEFKKKLTPEQYRILREKGTEAPFSGKYFDEKANGMYKCAACGNELFSSDAKFDSGTGWPSFTEVANRKNIDLKEDTSGGMSRVEVICKNCGSHLGHVFNDGPKEKGGQRFCINSACLELEEAEEDEDEEEEEKGDGGQGSTAAKSAIAGGVVAGIVIAAVIAGYVAGGYITSVRTDADRGTAIRAICPPSETPKPATSSVPAKPPVTVPEKATSSEPPRPPLTTPDSTVSGSAGGTSADGTTP